MTAMIKVYPDMLFSAIHHQQPVSAFRVWFLAKDFNPGGCGYIPLTAFHQHLREMGVPRSTLHRWLAQARALGLLQRWGKFYRIASWQVGAQVAGLDRVMQPVRIASRLFLSKGWLATCWAGVLLHFPGIIARETLTMLSGVPERTQFAYEKQSGVVNHPNYASFGRVVDDPQRAIRLYGIPGFFTRDGVILRRLPNHRSFMQVAGLEMASRGRTKHINRALVLKVASRPQEDALTAQNPISANPSMVPLRRLYCQHPSQLKRALRAWRNWQGDARQRPLFIYYHDPDTRPKHVYQAICL